MFKFKSDQMRVAKKIVALFQSGIDNVIIDSPTGSGKSGIANCVHQFMREENPSHNTIILNHQKVLIDNYEGLIGHQPDTVCIKGKNNYNCYITGASVIDAPCQVSGSCGVKYKCEYYIKRGEFLQKPMAVTVYQLVLSLLDINNYERRSDLAIYDECHNTEEIFVSYRQVNVSKSEIEIYEKFLKFIKGKSSECEKDLLFLIKTLKEFSASDYIQSFENFFSQLELTLTTLENIYDEETLENLLSTSKKEAETILRFISEQSRYLCKWNNYISCRAQTKYIFETDEDSSREPMNVSYSLVPLNINFEFEKMSKCISKKRLFMSATVLDPETFIEDLGLDPQSYFYLQVPSTFPEENRKVFLSPVARLNYRNTNADSLEMQNILRFIFQICENHGKNNESGVIFTSSYALSRLIVSELYSKLNNIGFTIMFNNNSSERDEVIQEFTEAKLKKRLLISPSFNEGVNFSDDISRFQILVKCPFTSLASERTRVKAELSRRWYEIKTLTTILQMCGRSIRHEKDYAITYVLDQNAVNLVNRYSDLLPIWFKESIEKC